MKLIQLIEDDTHELDEFKLDVMQAMLETKLFDDVIIEDNNFIVGTYLGREEYAFRVHWDHASTPSIPMLKKITARGVIPVGDIQLTDINVANIKIDIVFNIAHETRHFCNILAKEAPDKPAIEVKHNRNSCTLFVDRTADHPSRIFIITYEDRQLHVTSRAISGLSGYIDTRPTHTCHRYAQLFSYLRQVI
jgi:hypothetical protein